MSRLAIAVIVLFSFVGVAFVAVYLIDFTDRAVRRIVAGLRAVRDLEDDE